MKVVIALALYVIAFLFVVGSAVLIGCHIPGSDWLKIGGITALILAMLWADRTLKGRS